MDADLSPSGGAPGLVTLLFPDLSLDPADPIWVTIRDPRAVSEVELSALCGALETCTVEQAWSVSAWLIVAWRVYDAIVPPDIDPFTGEELPSQGVLLPSPPTYELIGRIPGEILRAVSMQVRAAAEAR